MDKKIKYLKFKNCKYMWNGQEPIIIYNNKDVEIIDDSLDNKYIKNIESVSAFENELKIYLTDEKEFKG